MTMTTTSMRHKLTFYMTARREILYSDWHMSFEETQDTHVGEACGEDEMPQGGDARHG